MHEQEIAAPETLARDRTIRLGIDREIDAGLAVLLRHQMHQHQHMAIGVGIDRAGMQRLAGQRHRIEIGVVVGRDHAHRAGVDDVADVTQIFGEIGRALRRLRLGLCRLLRDLRRGGLRIGRRLRTEDAEQLRRLGWRRSSGCGRRGIGVHLLGRRRRTRHLGVLDIEPLIAFRRLAAHAARAVRIAERQSHLESEIGTQEIDEVGAIGLAGSDIVLAAAEIVEQEIARLIAQHFAPHLPRQILVGRRVEQLFDPGREQRFGGAVPASPHLPDFSSGRRDAGRLARLDRDFARDGAASSRRRERRVPLPGRGLCDFGEPEIWLRPATVGRGSRNAAIGRHQRQRAIDRLFRNHHHAQRRARPWRSRRRQHGKIGRLGAIGSQRRRMRDRDKQRRRQGGKPA